MWEKRIDLRPWWPAPVCMSGDAALAAEKLLIVALHVVPEH